MSTIFVPNHRSFHFAGVNFSQLSATGAIILANPHCSSAEITEHTGKTAREQDVILLAICTVIKAQSGQEPITSADFEGIAAQLRVIRSATQYATKYSS